MRWIKFYDMMPPIGMNIFVANSKGEVSIVKWTKAYNNDDTKSILLHTDDWEGSRGIYSLDYWAPVHFLYKHLPIGKHGGLSRDQNWYVENIKHPNIQKIKDIAKDLNKKTYIELWELIKTDFGAQSYQNFKVEEVCKLIKECELCPKKGSHESTSNTKT